MIIYDTSDLIGDDRCKLYVNGSKIEIGNRNATASLGDVSYFNSSTSTESRLKVSERIASL